LDENLRGRDGRSVNGAQHEDSGAGAAGVVGYLRPRAEIAVFSSTDSTRALSGGSR
jgi:hypothetical protein